jgi:transmembrane sensor
MDEQDRQVEAINWVLRLRAGGSAEDWLAFTDWLEADPRNAAAYEEAELADEGLEALPPPAPLPEPEVPARRPFPTRRLVLGGGVAAAIVAAVGPSTLPPTEPTTFAVETRPGERRTIQLADGSRIDLNGNTRLLLDREDARSATVDRGEALFTIVHDERDPFEVVVGEARIVDLGTVFNVAHAGGEVEVGVAEGLVSYRQAGRPIELQPGMTLNVGNNRSAQITRGNAAEIAGWRTGRLSYRSASMRRVAADLSRNLGVQVEVDQQVANRPFTGVINLDDAAETIQRAASLMGVGATRRGDGGWILTPGTRETP